MIKLINIMVLYAFLSVKSLAFGATDGATTSTSNTDVAVSANASRQPIQCQYFCLNISGDNNSLQTPEPINLNVPVPHPFQCLVHPEDINTQISDIKSGKFLQHACGQSADPAINQAWNQVISTCAAKKKKSNDNIIPVALMCSEVSAPEAVPAASSLAAPGAPAVKP